MLFAKIYLVAWTALTLALLGSTDGDWGLGVIQAILPALLFASLTWLAVRRQKRKSPLLSPPVCTMLIFIGLIAFGGTYGQLRENGVPVGTASLTSLLGWAGIMFIGAVAMLFLSKNEKPNA